VGVGTVGGAVGVNVDIVNNTVKAEITDTLATGKLVSGDGGVEVSSLSRANVTTIAVGVAIGLGAIAGSA
jgi:hypothetical protein